MKLIPLTQGRFAFVDDVDFEWLNQWKWCYWKQKTNNTGYAVRNTSGGLNKPGILRMHREILGLLKGSKLQCDHKNGNGIDNRRCNIRACTFSQNMMNRKISKHNTSGYVGVSYNKRDKKWRSMISVKNIDIYLGYFDTKEEAALAYSKAAKKYFGQFVRLDKIP